MSGPVSLIDAQASRVLSILNAAVKWLNFHIIDGGVVSDGGTTQATGVNGTLNYDADVTATQAAVVNGVPHPAGETAGTDITATAGDTVNWGATSGVSVVFAVVLETGAANDTPAWAAPAHGAVAPTGSEQPPTDAEISAALGHDNWVRVCNHTVNRTGDTTVSHAFDITVRNPAEGLKALAEDEVTFRTP